MDKGKTGKKNIWTRMVAYFKTALPLLALSAFLALAIILADLINPYITKIIIDDYIGKGDMRVNIYFLGGLYLFCCVLGAGLQYVQVNLLNYMGQKIIHGIRMQIFSHIQHMSLKFFDKNSTGSLLTRVTNDIEAISELYSGVIIDLFKDFFMIIGIVGTMLAINWRIALVNFCVIPVIVVATALFNIKAKANFRWVRSLIARINAFFAENISGMKLVQIFEKQKEKYREYKEINDEYNKAAVTQVRLNAVFRPSSEFVNSLSISILIWFCAGDILGGALEFGVLYAFISYSKKFFAPINDLADKFTTIQAGRVSAERIFEVLDSGEYLEDLAVGEPIREIKGEIEFKNVWFAYNDEDYVLKDVSFKINANETAAFVGATGSGKSTIINLMGRFYEIQKGEILLDGVDIRRYRLDELRKSIAVVMQDVFLFAGDIKSNIRLNNGEISDSQIEEAAKYVNADPFIQQLPQKYGEPVMERGATLSAGQRQLLSFARAVAFSPPILVLDEATASIDTENEQIIQTSLKKISENRTTVIIAHRLSTIKNADKIIVIHEGEISETGKHEELLKNGGIYSKLHEAQNL